MEINNSFSVHGPHNLQPAGKPHITQRQEVSENIFEAQDELEISTEAKYLTQIRQMPDVRADRVADLKAQIQAGDYDTDEKLEVALDRLFDDYL